MTIEFGQLIVWIIIGGLAGFIAGQILRYKSFGLVGNTAIGLVGALIGGVIFSLLGIDLQGFPTFTFSVADLLIAILGAVVLMLILRRVPSRRRRR